MAFDTEATFTRHKIDLLPNEVAVELGCLGCQHAVAGVYTGSGDKDHRKSVATAITELSDVSGIPVHVTPNGGPRFHGSCEDGSGCDPADMGDMASELTATFGMSRKV